MCSVRLQFQAAPASFLQKPTVPGVPGARPCGRYTAAFDKRDALLCPRPLIPKSRGARPKPGLQAPRRICLASAQFSLQRRLIQLRSRHHSGSPWLPCPGWLDPTRRAHHALPRGSPHPLRPASASACSWFRVPASAQQPRLVRQTPLAF